MIPTMTIERNNIRQIPAGSWNRTIPRTTVPTAPIPVQTAYAVPIGSSLVAISRNRKLAIKPITVIADGISFVKFAEYFRLIAYNTSKKLAINNSIHAIFPFSFYISCTAGKNTSEINKKSIHMRIFFDLTIHT